MNLEVHLPRWEKDDATRKELKSLNLMANGRNMIKKGTAKWVGSQHSQELRKAFSLFLWCVLFGIPSFQLF